MPQVGRKREHRHVGYNRGNRKVHVVTGHIEWDKNAPADVRRFEIIKMHNPEPRPAKIIEGLNGYDVYDVKKDEIMGTFRDISEAKLWAQKHGYEATTAVRSRQIGGGGTSYREVPI